MAKIPIILEPGRADGKLIKTNSVYDDNQEKFLSDKIKDIDNNHNNLKDEVNTLTEVINNNESDIEAKLKTEKTRATNAENNLRETINNITEISGSATTANIVTIDTIPNTSSSNVQQALHELFNTDEELNNAIIEEKERAEIADKVAIAKNEEQDQKLYELERKVGEEVILSSQSYTIIVEYKIQAGEKYILTNLADEIQSVKSFDKDGNLFNWNKPKEILFSVVDSKQVIITPTLDAEGIGVSCTTNNINAKILNYNSLTYTNNEYGKNFEDIDKSIADIDKSLKESNTKFEESCYKKTTNIPFNGGNGYLKMDSTSIVTDVSWFYTKPIKVHKGDKIECESTCSVLVNKAVIAKYNNINRSYEPLVPFTSIEKKKYIYEFTEDCEVVCFNYNNTNIDNSPIAIKLYLIKNYVDAVADNTKNYTDTVADNTKNYVDIVADNITTYERNLCWSKGGINSGGNFTHINEDGSIYRKRTSFLDGGIVSLKKECKLSFAYYDENKVFKKYIDWNQFSGTIDINSILNENESKYVIIIVDNHPYYNIGDRDIIWFYKGYQSLSTTIDDIKLSKYSLTDVEKAMIKTVKEIRQNSPRAIIYLIGNFYTGNDYQKNYYRRRYYAELKAVAEYFGCEYISLLGCGIMENNIKEENYGYYTKDGVHAYLKEGAERIFNFINGHILSDISNLSGKKVLILGDSSCVQEPHFSDSEAVKFANRDKKVWTQLLAEKYPEATIIVKSQGGSGWMYNGETSQRTCLVQYNENEDKNFDVIFITTGANDGLQNYSIGNYEKMLDVLFREDITINGYTDKPIYSIE